MIASGAVLVAIPVAGVLAGATVLRHRPRALLGAFYGLEAPLLLVFAVRFFAIGQLNPATALLFWTALVGLGAYAASLVRPPRSVDPAPVLGARLAVLTALMAACAYVAAWLAIYAGGVAGLLGELLRETASELAYSLRNLSAGRAAGQLSLAIWGSLTFALTATLFVVAPVVVPLLHGAAWRDAWRALARRSGRGPAVAVTAVAAVAIGAAFARSSAQPQAAAFARLAQPPATAAAGRALLADRDALRAGLLNAYLWPRRYLGARGSVTHVRDLYREAWGSASLAEGALRAWEGLARPLLYEPVPAAVTHPGGAPAARGEDPPDDARRAAALYEAAFDVPLLRAERETVAAAVRSDWQVERMATTLMDVDDREVHLERQVVSVTEHGDWAEVEVHEVYRNQTLEPQEVLYHVSLPETAAITGLWLGTSDDRADRFAFRVAPRGAAQAVYRAETVRRRDPALAEQIGPRQYRLRAFPIPPRERVWDQGDGRAPRTLDGEPLHLWLTYRVLVAGGTEGSGARWPLPRLAEERNVFWDARSERTVGGQPFVDPEAWLPPSLPATAPPRRAHDVVLADGYAARVIPEPPGRRRSLPPLRLAVVLDRSLGMEALEAAVDEALEAARAASDRPVDVYLTASPLRFDAPRRTTLDDLTADDRLAFGGMASAALLGQFAALRGDRSYDAVLVLTDEGGFAPAGDGLAVSGLGSPTWLVHLGGAFPPGYDDATQDALLASGGGVSASVDEALARIAETRAGSVGGPPRAVLLDEGWRVEAVAPTPGIGGDAAAGAAGDAASAPQGGDDGLRAIAARAVVSLEAQRLDATQDASRRTEILDRLHAVAVREAVVTPFSSMIVLVEARQERALDAAEQAADRFEREVESGDDALDPTLSMTVVPEPHEYALLALAALALAWRFVRRPQPGAPNGRGAP